MARGAGSLADRLETVLGSRPDRVHPLRGGCVGEVYLASFAKAPPLVVKVDGSASPMLDVEGRMLRYLAERSSLPVPGVIHDEPSLLAMEFIESGAGGGGAPAEEHAADLLAALHDVDAGRGYGLDFDTLIGGLPQPNGWEEDWARFFGERRLVEMATQAREAGRIDAELAGRVRRLAEALPGLIGDAAGPSLIHGDVWGGNVLTRGGRIAGFIDPAIYYADAEVELAFTTLFGTFGERFFARYAEHRPIRDGFRDTRRELYNLYPLLVHARLFGGHYVGSVEQTLRRFGF